MKTVALISGGKDSCFNMMCCIAEGHEITALANLRPESRDTEELDSHMFQTVGHTAIDHYAEAMGLMLYTQNIVGSSKAIDRNYSPTEGDEVEDLYMLLKKVKEQRDIEAVSVGAILSDYQRIRVENVCQRLNLSVFSFLWRRDQGELLKEMIDCGVKAKIIKVAALGLKPDKHLGMDLEEIYPHMLKMQAKYGLNICGEGGEYETFVYDCPLFKKKIVVDETEKVIHSDDAFAPVGYLSLKKCHVEQKEMDPNIALRAKILQLPISTSVTWIETHVLSDPPQAKEDGGGDTGDTGLVLCVPDMVVTGDMKPTVRTDDVNFQVSCVRAIVSEGTNIADATEMAMQSLKTCLDAEGLNLCDVVSMSLYVGDMDNFGAINSVYMTYFESNPPVRLCIQANLPRNVALQIDCQGRVADEVDKASDRQVMHVQALSHWAPANIGPYSQAVLTGDKMYVAGIVPLVPANLEVVEGEVTTQCSVALGHVEQVLSAMVQGCRLENCPLAMCYVTNKDFIISAKGEWKSALEFYEVEFGEEKEFQPFVQYSVVSALPKGVKVEWHVYAWPNLEQDDQLKELDYVGNYPNYTITSRATFCVDKPELFSCHMTADVRNQSDFQHLETLIITQHMVEEYAKVCAQHSTDKMRPLVKVLFSPTLFNYLYLHKCFDQVITTVCDASNIIPPVISIVPVSHLETRNQVLAWCQ